MLTKVGCFAFALLLNFSAFAEVSSKKVFIVVLENTDARKAIKQSFLKNLAQKGAYLDKFYAVARPSQPNYIAMTSGNTHGVKSNKSYDLDVINIADRVEEKGLQWKSYADDYPGECFTGEESDRYRRKHQPFISYLAIQKNPERCARIVNSKELDTDVALGTLPHFSFYVPDMDNDGHDTDVTYADKWLQKRFTPLLENEVFMKDMLFIVTFDESSYLSNNKIYTSLYGPFIKPGVVSMKKYNFYNLLKTIQNYLGLENLGQKDANASAIDDIWAAN